MTPIPPRRRWFRYSLRTMFVVVTVLAMILSWVAYSLNWIRQRHALLSERKTPYTKHADFNPYDRTMWLPGFTCTAPGFLWIFGETGFESLGLGITVDHDQYEDYEKCVRMAEPDLTRARLLFPEAEVRIGGWTVVPVKGNRLAH